MEQVITESDSNEIKTKLASNAPALGADDSPIAESTQLVNLAGIVSPSESTAGAEIPALPEAKRGRGRPRKDDTKRSHKKKTAPATKEGETVPDYIQAAALYNMVLVGGCRLLSDEYHQSDELRDTTLKAATEYFESIEVQVPAWAGLLAVTAMNIGAAARTEKARSRLSEAWAKVRAWYLLRKG